MITKCNECKTHLTNEESRINKKTKRNRCLDYFCRRGT